MAAPVRRSTCHFVLIFAFLVALCVGEKREEEVISLNSSTWKDSLEGEWFVEFYAPWCPACQNFAAKYEEFAKHAPTYNVRVAKIDITENPALSGRFLVTSLPTIFYMRDGLTRHYQGGRGLQDLLNYLRNEDWKATTPVPWYKSPSSIPMTIVSWFFELSVIIRTIHEMMVEEFGIPVWGSYIVFAVLTLIAGLALGMILVLLCDCLCPPKPRSKSRPTPDKYDKIGDDSDLQDDGESKDEEDTETSDTAQDEQDKPAAAAAAAAAAPVRKRKPRRDT